MKDFGNRYGYKLKDAEGNVLTTNVHKTIKEACNSLSVCINEQLPEEYRGSKFLNYDNLRHIYSNPKRVNPWVKSRVEVFVIDLKKMFDDDKGLRNIEFNTYKVKKPVVESLLKGITIS